ncbi:Chitinase, GH18 family [Chitinophaga costaii]|uniref:chitinase n=2 Tax=Chitinophaga costaii TaxID=1335309 RepID=A0A1C4CVB5_9BACT|nr:Chitinase, GH18 family [Chitinophaga costaii]
MHRNATYPPTDSMRILGYYNSDNHWYENISGLDLTKLTDLNIAFLNPNTAGTFSDYNLENLEKVVALAHAKKIRVYFAIGGGNPPATLASQLTPANRAAFINNIIQLANNLNFDGVDVDLENNLITDDTARYGSFIREVSAALKAHHKLLSAALVTWSSGPRYIATATLQQFDYINIMSYDSTGVWNTQKPGQHSSYTLAINDFQFFRSRGIPAHRLLLGVPFYGYAFGPGYPSPDSDGSFTYRDIVHNFPGSENLDTVVVPGKGTIYYNGLPTIQQKAAYAKAQGAAGIMIWELQQDLPASDTKSLLSGIYRTIH